MLMELRDVSYTYSPDTSYAKTAVSHVSLSIEAGEFIAVIGHTGSGKSTLIQLLNALLIPTEGQVFYHGRDIMEEGFDRRAMRTRIGLVFQYPENQLFEEDVVKDVAFGPKNQGCTPEEAEKRAKEALRAVGVEEKYDAQSPFELSGGQKRRVAIAGVLAMDPEILILDEPTAGLDPMGRDAILREAKRLQKERNITVILVSHSMEDVAAYAERVLVMADGALLMDGTTRQVFHERKILEDTGLTVPEAAALIQELREAGFPEGDDVITVEEARDEILRVFGKL